MKIIERKELREGYGYDGLSIVLVQFKNGYGVYYHIHCEDRFSELYTTPNELEARECFREEIDKLQMV
jgi:hypothetical protein